MKLRITFIAVVIVALASTSSAVYQFHSLNTYLRQDSARQAVTDVETLSDQVEFYLSQNLKTAGALSGLKEIRQALLTPDNGSIESANRILDHFRNAFGVEVCYLMDRQGNTVASSNRKDVDSFVGKNFSFRPYFQESVQGKASVYLALGTTSKVPGAYYGQAVYQEGEKSPIGVIVVKASVKPVEEFFKPTRSKLAVLIDPHGLIFVSNSKEWLYRFLWKANESATIEFEKSHQFGNGPWTWSGFVRKGTDNAVDGSGSGYALYEKNVDGCPGWKIVTLNYSKAH